MKQGIAEARQKIGDVTQAIKQEAAEHARATEARKAAAQSEQQVGQAAARTAETLKAATQVEQQYATQAERMTATAGAFMAEQVKMGAAAQAATAAEVARQGSFREISQQRIALRKEEGAALARLEAIQAGESKIAQDVAAKYSFLDAETRKLLTDTKEQIIAAEAQAKAAGAAAGATEKAAVSLRTLGFSAQQAGRLLTAGITAPLLGIGAFALKGSQDIQKAMNLIREQTGATGERLAGLGQSFRAVAGQVPQDMETVGKAVATVAQRTGLTGQALSALSTQFLTLSRITNTDVEPLITKATKVFQQFGIAASQQEEALNQLNRAHEATGIGVDDLLSRMLKFAPTFKLIGLGATESEALLGAFNKQGIVGDRAITALNSTFAKWAKEGIPDLHKAFTGLIAAIQKAPSHYAALKIAAEAGLSGLAGANFVNTVRSGGTEMQKFLDIILHGKDTIKKAGDDTLTVANQFQQLKNKIALAAEPLGTFIAQQLKGLGKALDDDTPKLKRFFDSFAGQSDDLKRAEIAVGALFAVLGPGVYTLGRVVQGWQGLKLVLAAGLPIAAAVAVIAFFAAILTNFHGLRDDLETGWRVLWEHIGNRLKAFIDFAVASFEIFATPFKGDIEGRAVAAWSKFGKETGEAFVKAQRDAVQAQQQAIARRSQPSGIEAGEAEVKAALGGAGLAGGEGELRRLLQPPAPRPPKGLGGGDPRNAPNLRPPPKETAEQREFARLQAAVNAAQDQYNALLDQSSTIAGKVARQFGNLHSEAAAALRAQLVSLDTRIEKETKSLSGLDRYNRLLAEVNAKIKEVEAGGKPAQAAKDFGPKVTPAMQAYLQAQQERLARDEQEAKTRADLATKIASALSRETARHLELTGAKAKEASATVLLATAENQLSAARGTGNAVAIKAAEQNVAAARHVLNLAAADDRLAAVLTRLQNAEKGEQATLDQVTAGLTALAAKHQEVMGATVEEVNAQKVYQETLKLGTGIVATFYQNQALFAIAQSEIDKQTLADKKELARVTTGLSQIQARAQEVIDSYGAKVTLTTRAEEGLKAALLTHDEATIKLAQDTLTLAKAADAATLAHKQQQKELTDLQKALQKTAQFVNNEFEKAFKSLVSGGAKNFFKNLLADLNQFLLDWAAKIAAAQLTKALFGGLGLDQASGASGGSGNASQSNPTSGLLGGVLTSVLSGLLPGGGGASAADAAAAIGGGIGPAGVVPTAADLSSLGAQAGGFLLGGEPRLVGERGPELFIPSQSGQLLPNNQLQTAGVGRGTTHIHQSFTINTPDVAGFKRSMGQILADSHRSAEAARLRNGG